MLRKLLLVLTMMVCVATVCDSAKPRTVDAAKKEKKSAQRKIDETNRKLNDRFNYIEAGSSFERLD